MKVKVRYIEVSSYSLIEGDTRFKCDHEYAEVEYDQGGDGITEPGPSHSVYCSDCHNKDLEQYEVDDIVDAYLGNLEEDEACND
jgi:hypothetical protein